MSTPDDAAPGNETTPPGEGEPAAALDRDLRAMREEHQHLGEQLKRALADAANMRRRQKLELDDARRRIVEGFTQELLPVLDSFRLALQAWDERKEPSDPRTLIDGVRLVRTLLEAALERHGLQEIQAADQPFDPGRHEAVAVATRPGIAPGRVLEVLQPGYLLGDRVLRHAKVLVSGQDQPDESRGGGAGAPPDE